MAFWQRNFLVKIAVDVCEVDGIFMREHLPWLIDRFNSLGDAI